MSSGYTLLDQIAYGGLTMGGSSSYPIDGRVVWREDREAHTGLLQFSFLYAASSHSDLSTAHSGIVAVLTTRRQDVTWTQGGSTLVSWDHGSATGMNSRCQYSWEDEEANVGLLRRYTLLITVDLPALSAEDGRLSSEVQIEILPSEVRRITLIGTWTAVGADSAYTKWAAEFDDWANTVKTALTGTWDRGERQASYDYDNRILQFSAVFEELAFPQDLPNGVTDHDDIRKAQITISHRNSAPGDSPHAEGDIVRLQELQIRWDAWLYKDASEAMRAFYDSTIKEHMIQAGKQVTDTDDYALVDEDISFDPMLNKFSVVHTILAASESIGIIGAQIVVEDRHTLGTVRLPMHASDPDTALIFQGPSTRLRTTTQTIRKRKTTSGSGDPNSQRGVNLIDPFAAAQTDLGKRLGAFGLGKRLTFGISPVYFTSGDFAKSGNPKAANDITTQGQASSDGYLRIPFGDHIIITQDRRLGQPGYSFDVTDQTIVSTELLYKAPNRQGSSAPSQSRDEGIPSTEIRTTGYES